MARRSYLQRIARPVAPGEPMPWPIPTAAPDEARPPALAPLEPALAGTVRDNGAPVLRRRARAPSEPAAPTTSVAAPPAEASAEPVAAPAQPASAATLPEPGTAPKAVRPALADPTPRIFAPDATRLWPQAAPASRPAPVVSEAAPGVPGRAALPPEAGGEATDFIETAPVARFPETATPDRLPVPLAPTLSPVPGGLPGNVPPRPVAEERAAPRLHIGTIEIRTTAPPVAPPPPAQPAPPAPRPMAEPVSRAYLGHYGLIQG